MRWTRFAITVWAVLTSAAFAMAEEAAVEIGDVERGAKVFKKCASCHEVGQGAKHRVGPHLNGIFDRKAAQFDDYNYSKGILRASSDGLVWDLEHLDAYVENPKVLVSGTRMSFRGLKDQKDRVQKLKKWPMWLERLSFIFLVLGIKAIALTHRWQ